MLHVCLAVCSPVYATLAVGSVCDDMVVPDMHHSNARGPKICKNQSCDLVCQHSVLAVLFSCQLEFVRVHMWQFLAYLHPVSEEVQHLFKIPSCHAKDSG